MDQSAQATPPASLSSEVVLCWMPAEGEVVSVTDYPSPSPFGVVETIERDSSGSPLCYWIWMLDGSRIPLEAHSVPVRLARAPA
jgi:hypothetical protein